MNTKTVTAKNTGIAVSKDRIVEDLQLMVADTEDLLRATAHQAGEEVAGVRTRIEARLQGVKANVVAAEAAMIERARQAAKVTDQYVHDNPWKSISVSALAGAVIGMLIARR